MSDFTIKNRLRVLRGNKLVIPGCEPISAFTSTTLAANWPCKASVVDLDAALEAIPGSTIIEFKNTGGYGRELYFVLPSGPPQSPNMCDDPCKGTVEDWYQVLRDIAEEEYEEQTTDEGLSLEDLCRSFPLKGIF
jgi:hypothetical protein